MFYLTRFLVEAFTPINISIALIIITLFFLLLHKARAAIACLSVAIFILLFCGYGFVVKKEIGKREQMFPALTEERVANLQDRQIDYIVVLGSAHVSDNRLPETSQIGSTSLFRLAEGLRLLNLFSGAKLRNFWRNRL